MKIESIISTLKSELGDLIETYNSDITELQVNLKSLIDSSSNFDHNWAGQWASQNYNVYKNIITRSVNKLIQVNEDEIQKHIEKESGVKLKDIKDKIPIISKAYKDFQDKLVTELSVIKGIENLKTEAELLNKIESHEWGMSPWDYVKLRRPKSFITYDPASIMNKGGLDTPPHLIIGGELMSLYSILDSTENFDKNAKRILRQLEIKYSIEDTSSNKSDFIIKLINSFHNVSRQILNRHDKRETIVINDEYDVQDLLHALLRIEFDDIRPEENTPSYAGSSTRVDFLLKNEKIIIEVKKTRKGLADKEVGDQLILDSQHYKTHPDCNRLICFVYDPENRIRNPRGLENDLNKLSTDVFIVEVYIRQ